MTTIEPQEGIYDEDYQKYPDEPETFNLDFGTLNHKNTIDQYIIGDQDENAYFDDWFDMFLTEQDDNPTTRDDYEELLEQAKKDYIEETLLVIKSDLETSFKEVTIKEAK